VELGAELGVELRVELGADWEWGWEWTWGQTWDESCDDARMGRCSWDQEMRRVTGPLRLAKLLALGDGGSIMGRVALC